MNLSMQEAQQKEDSKEVIPENNTPTHAANQVTGSQARIMADETLIDSLGTQNAAVKPKFLCPPTFNPCTSSASSFIEKYERTAAANSWNNTHKISYFGTFLEGAAQLWFKRYAANGTNNNKKWGDIKNDFSKEFDGADRTHFVERLLFERKQKPNESIKAYSYELQTLFEDFDPNFELEKFRKFFGNEIRKEYCQNYRLLLGENMGWEDFRRIIDKLEDIYNQDVLETSLNNMTISAEKQQTCNCSCENNTGLQNLPRSNSNPNFWQTGTRSFQHPPKFSHPQDYSYTRPNYFTPPKQEFLLHQDSLPINFIKITTQIIIPPKGKTPTTLILHQNIHQSNSAQRIPTQSYPPRNQTFIPYTRTNEGRPKCQICNRIGHSASTCYKNNHPNERRQHN
ncbi:hypothetical protein JTB14_001147 [Gonioctena quinquepunctata]|nr:hypothetical protein JTB14_001147 [Gonioctena quinquepunctata]